jgi:hypothetical protein
MNLSPAQERLENAAVAVDRMQETKDVQKSASDSAVSKHSNADHRVAGPNPAGCKSSLVKDWKAIRRCKNKNIKSAVIRLLSSFPVLHDCGGLVPKESERKICVSGGHQWRDLAGSDCAAVAKAEGNRTAMSTDKFAIKRN